MNQAKEALEGTNAECHCKTFFYSEPFSSSLAVCISGGKMRRRRSRGVGVHGAPAAVTYRCRLLWPDLLPDLLPDRAIRVCPPCASARRHTRVRVCVFARCHGYPGCRLQGAHGGEHFQLAVRPGAMPHGAFNSVPVQGCNVQGQHLSPQLRLHL